MFGSRTKMELPTAETALAGRDVAIMSPGAHFVNGRPIAPPFPEGIEIAYFGMGCFWGAERVFWQLPGVYSTSVGYGASLGGLAALLGMLNSCAAGVTVVNIDNGFGAGCAAARINQLAQHETR